MKPEYLEAIINEISNTEVLTAIMDAAASAPAHCAAETILQVVIVAMCV